MRCIDPVDHVAFDHDRRRVTTVVRRAGEDLLVTVGDPEDVLPLCSTARRTGAPEDLTADLTAALRIQVRDCVAAHQAYGMRVRAVAARTGPARSLPYGPWR